VISLEVVGSMRNIRTTTKFRDLNNLNIAGCPPRREKWHQHTKWSLRMATVNNILPSCSTAILWVINEGVSSSNEQMASLGRLFHTNFIWLTLWLFGLLIFSYTVALLFLFHMIRTGIHLFTLPYCLGLSGVFLALHIQYATLIIMAIGTSSSAARNPDMLRLCDIWIPPQTSLQFIAALLLLLEVINCNA
jgi:hypothetical protein